MRLILLLLLFVTNAFAGFPQGDHEKMYKDALQFKSVIRTLTAGAVDPTSVATPGEPGDIYFGSSDVYFKTDSGTSTNWTTIVSGTGGLVDLTSQVTGILPIANGGTGTSSTTFVDAATNVTGVLPIANGGTGTSSTTFVDAATNVTGVLPVANGGTGTSSTTFVDAATNVTGVLPVANGGTNSSTALNNNFVMISSGGSIVEDSNISTTELGYLDNVSSNIQTQLDGKVDEVSSTDNAITRFDGTTGSVQDSGVLIDDTNNISGIADLTVTGTATLNTSLTGPLKAASGVVSASAIDLTSEVTGILPIANGGTGSATQNFVDLTTAQSVAGVKTFSNKPIFSSGFDSNDASTIDDSGAGNALTIGHSGSGNGLVINHSGSGYSIDANNGVRFTGLTASRALTTNSSQELAVSATTDTELGYLSGVTSAVQTQLDDKASLTAANTFTSDNTFQSPATFQSTATFESAATFVELASDADTPASGNRAIFAKSDGLYQIDDAGTVSELGPGNASGINYIDNNDIETDTTGYSTFDDASAYVDGTGGTASNLTLSRNTTTPLRETGDLKLVQGAADSSYEGFSYDFTIDKGMQGEMLTGSFWYDTSDANYVDDDIRIFIYDKDNSQIIRVNGEDLKGGKGVHYFQFQAAADADDYRVSFMVNQSNTNGYSIYFDQIAVSPTRLARGAIVTKELPLNITLTNMGNASIIDSVYTRKGGILSGRVWITIGSTLPSGSISFTLDDYSVDTTNMTTGAFVGQARSFDLSAGYDGSIYYSTANSNFTFYGGGGSSIWNATNPFTWAQNDVIGFNFEVPIQGWEAEGTLAEDLGGGDVVVRGANNTGAPSSGALTGNTTDIWFDEVEDTASAWDGDQFTVPSSGDYSIEGSIRLTSATNATIDVYVDTVLTKTLGYTNASSLIRNFSTVMSLTKGQVVSLRTDTNANLTNNAVQHHIHIQKLATGSQKFETATVAARYTSNSGQSWVNAGYLDYEDIDYDTHGAYDTSTGEYTVPISGKYIVSASGMCDSEVWLNGYVLGLNIVVNGSATTQSLHYTAAMTSNLYTSVRDTLDLAKGDVIEVQASTNISTNMNTQSKRNVFSIIRIK